MKRLAPFLCRRGWPPTDSSPKNMSRASDAVNAYRVATGGTACLTDLPMKESAAVAGGLSAAGTVTRFDTCRSWLL